jgi:hypothetical protein
VIASASLLLAAPLSGIVLPALTLPRHGGVASCSGRLELHQSRRARRPMKW